MKYIFLLLFILICFKIHGQTSMLDQLQKKKTLHIEWATQKYLMERESEIPDYPLYPDQLKEGEKEAFVGLKLELDNCTVDSCLIKIWVEYISTIEFSKRIKITDSLDLFHTGTPTSAKIFPAIQDTRYVYKKSTLPSFSLGILDSFPLLVNINKKMGGLDGLIFIGDSECNNPVYFDNYSLQVFLKSFLNADFLDKESFNRVAQKKVIEGISAHFFRVVHPPQKTVLTGKINLPTIDTFMIRDFRDESLINRMGQDEIVLDEFGRFRISTMLDKPRDFTLHYGFNTLRLYMEPGDSLHVNIDANAFYRNTNFDGDQTIANQFLLDFYHSLRGDEVMKGLDENLLQMSQVSYLEKLQKKKKEELNYLQEHRSNLNPTFFTHMDRSIKLENASDLWYHAGWFYRQRDAHLHPDFINYAQHQSRYLFRLPENKRYDQILVDYLEFQKLILKGVYTNRSIGDSSYDDFEMAKMLLSPHNAFRLGRQILYWEKSDEPSDSFLELASELKEMCSDLLEIKDLNDFLNSNFAVNKPSIYNTIAIGEAAPAIRIENHLEDSIRLSDYKGKYVLLHLGIHQNLSQAIKDVEKVRSNTSADFAVLSIIADNQSNDSLFLDRPFVNYISFKEMHRLRNTYNINDNSNHYYLIDPNGKVLSNSFYTSSFQKLQNAIRVIPIKGHFVNWNIPANFWRNLGLLSVVLLGICLVYIQRRKLLSKRERQKRQIVELELKGIRSQMNPHFLFNALSSIQNLIRKKDAVRADRYLTQFAGLVRRILQNSEHEFITLEEELSAIEEYCSLESLRTPFAYDINVSENIDRYNTYIPGMILQPLIENAIIHGLATKDSNRNLWITISKNGIYLSCEIKDNGIGIKKASLITKQSRHKKSFGLALVKQRLQLLLNQPENDFIKIIDQSELDKPSTGTIVQLTLPTEE